MKKRNWVIFLLLIALALAACGGATNTAVSNSPADAAAPAAVESAAPADLELPLVVDAQTVADVKEREDVLVIDVREQWEYNEKHIPGVTLIPLGTISERLNEIPTDQTVILTCRSGNRSGQAVDFLRQQGFTNVHNMDGGIIAWEAEGFGVER